MKLKTFLGLTTSVCILTGTLVSCNKAGGGGYKKLDKNISDEITVMMWSGDGTFMKDIGHKNISPQDLKGQNQAVVYAVAKAFNEVYPNVKINIFAKSGGPDDDAGSWAQHMENFKSEHGKYPDVFVSTNLVNDIAKGLVADLSVFADDPMYKSFNPSVMQMMNYYGFQAGLPQFILPHGVYINKSLAEQNNIDIPKVTWSIDDYTNFVSQGNTKDFWGAMDVPMEFLDTGTKDFRYRLAKHDGKDGNYININSDEVKSLLEYVPKWAKNAVWPQRDIENVSQEIMEEYGWWAFNFFTKNKILTLNGDPWMMGDAAHPDPNHWGAVQASDWDIYPRPSTKYQPNTIGVVIDPMAIHNYAMDDGNPEWSETEKNKLKTAYTFVSFWVGDSAAMKARAEQQFLDNTTLKTAMNDSFPLVTGAEFDRQMEIWYSTETHQRFADKNKMPGFQEVIRLWKEGQFWDISSKTYPYFIEEDGTTKTVVYEWDNIYNPDIVGARRTDSNWLDQVKAKLPDWNANMNARFKKAEQNLKDGLMKYYGFKESDFNK